MGLRHVRGAESGISPWIGLEELERLEEADAGIQRGDAVLLWRGWSDEHYRPLPEGGRLRSKTQLPAERLGWPAPSVEFSTSIADRGVRPLSVDGPPPGALHAPFAPHRAALSRWVKPPGGVTNRAWGPGRRPLC